MLNATTEPPQPTNSSMWLHHHLRAADPTIDQHQQQMYPLVGRALVGVAIVVLNALVVLAKYRERRGCLRGIRYSLLTHLAVADLLLGAALLIFSVYCVMETVTSSGVLRITVDQCYGFHMVALLAGTSSIYHLLAVTINQYLAIAHPLRYHQYVTRTRYYITVTAIWSFSLFQALLIFTDDNYSSQRGTTLCRGFDTMALGYSVYFSLTIFIIPSVVLITIYIYIYIIVRSCQHNTTAIPATPHTDPIHDQSTQRKQRRMQDIKTVGKLASVVVIFILSWIGYWTVGLAFKLQGKSSPELLGTIGIANSMYNPIIYAIRFEEFKIAYRMLFCSRFDRKQLTVV